MPREFHAEIIEQEGVVFRSEVLSARLPGYDGLFGVMAYHAPMIAQLSVGEVTLHTPGDERLYFAVGGGVCQVGDNQLILLVRSAEASTDIEIERAQSAADRARERLARSAHERTIDVHRAQLALTRALNRLKVARYAQT